jgi:hypothetical protein
MDYVNGFYLRDAEGAEKISRVGISGALIG